MSSGFSGRMPGVQVNLMGQPIDGSNMTPMPMHLGIAQSAPSTQHPQPQAPRGNSQPQTVRQFLQSPAPTILPQEYAGPQAGPLPMYMVGGSPYPHSSQHKLAHWNRIGQGSMPAGVTYVAPKSAMFQT